MTKTNSMMAASVPTFLQENFLTCKICFDVYKEPKILVCLHSFCLRCLENHLSEATNNKQSGAIICPVCREKTLLGIDGVMSLKSNFYIKNLIEFVEASAFGKTSCHLTNDSNLCKSESTEENLHQNRSHLCKRHGFEIEDFYCQTCKTSACRLCVLSQHKSHDFAKSSETLDEDLSMILQDVNDKIQSLKEYMSYIDGRREEIIAEKALCIENVNIASSKIIEKLKCETHKTVDDIKGRFDELDSKLTLLKEAGRKDLHMMESFVETSISDVESGKYDLNHLRKSVETITKRFENCLSKYQQDLTIKQKIRMTLTELAKCNELYKLFEIVHDEPVSEIKKDDMPPVLNKETMERHMSFSPRDEMKEETEKDKLIEIKADERSSLMEVPDPTLELEIKKDENVVLKETMIPSGLTSTLHDLKEDSRGHETSVTSLVVPTDSSKFIGSESILELTPVLPQEEVKELNTRINEITVPRFPLLQPLTLTDIDAAVVNEENLTSASKINKEETVTMKETSNNKETTPTLIEHPDVDASEANESLPPKIPKRIVLVRRTASLERKIPPKNAYEKVSEETKPFTGWKLYRSNSLESARTSKHTKVNQRNEIKDTSNDNNHLINFFQCNEKSDRMTVRLTAVQWYDQNTFVVIDENNCKLKYIRAEDGQCLRNITVKNAVSITRSKSLVVIGLREPRLKFINNGDQHEVKLPLTREDVRPVVSLQHEELIAVICADRLLIVSETRIEERHLTDRKGKPLRVKPMFASNYKNVNILVSDWLQHRISILSDSGNLLQEIKMSSVPTSEGIFRTPGDLCSDSSGNIYVIEYWKSVLVQFNSNGNYVRNINLRTYARLPKGISLLDDVKLIVASQNGVAILQIEEHK